MAETPYIWPMKRSVSPGWTRYATKGCAACAIGAAIAGWVVAIGDPCAVPVVAVEEPLTFVAETTAVDVAAATGAVAPTGVSAVVGVAGAAVWLVAAAATG